MANQYAPITTDIFIIRAKNTHGEKYDYSKSVYTGKENKLIIICPDHGEFLQTPSNHTRGSGCRKCSKKLAWEKRTDRITTEIFIKKAKKIHGEKYDYSLSIYEKPYKKLIVICPDHGQFFSDYSHITKGVGCPKCGVLKATETKIKNGFAISKEKRTEYELYEFLVNKFTDQNYRIYKHLINPLDLPRKRSNGYHLDHKFSKQQGFLENILPEIIGHWTNLQMLPSTKNRKKYMSCSITKELLLETYQQYKE